MKALGFMNVPLGQDGPQAFKLAEEWNRRWDAVRTGQAPSPAILLASNLSDEQSEELRIYPPRSLGAAFREYRRTKQWSDEKKPRTREDWWRAWKRIRPVFGDVDPRTVSLGDVDAWRAMIEETVSLGEAHRATKIWRALWQAAAALKYCSKDSDPSFGVKNRAPRGRSEVWLEGEAARLAKRAWRMGFHGLAGVIAVAWDTQLAPVDVRTLRASQFTRDQEGAYFFTERGKTDTPVGGALTARTMKTIAAYLNRIGMDLHGDAYIFRNRSGVPYSKDTLGDDFRDVRAAEFGEAERRTLGHDFRRSGAREAIMGGAKPAELSHAMGNTLSSSNSLFKTYVPVNLVTIRAVSDARRKGRAKLK
jgi:hypothetical protein